MTNKYQKELDVILKDILNAAKNSKIKIWLEAGSLLGCMRNNDYIPWEKDIDFGSWDFFLSNHRYIKFKKNMKQKKYVIKKLDNVVTIRKHGLSCYADINFYKKKNNNAVMNFVLPVSKLSLFFNRLLILFKSKNIFKTLKFHRSLLIKVLYMTIYYIFNFLIPFKLKNKILKQLAKLKNRYSTNYSWNVPLKFLSNMKKVKFRDFTVPIPYKSKDYMRFRYGKDWKTPKSNWTFLEDDTIKFAKTK